MPLSSILLLKNAPLVNKPSKPPKPPKQTPWGKVCHPPTPSHTPRLGLLFARLASPGPSWTSNVHRKNEHNLLMDPFGSDTRRYDMHYTCHSTSIYRFWGQLFTFRRLSSIIFMKSYPKVVPILRTLKNKNPNTEPQGVPEALKTFIR